MDNLAGPAASHVFDEVVQNAAPGLRVVRPDLPDSKGHMFAHDFVQSDTSFKSRSYGIKGTDRNSVVPQRQ